MILRPTGWRPDREDARDRNADEVLAVAPPAGALPRFVSHRDLIVSVLDQGSLSSCVANAIMQAIRASHVRQGRRDLELGSRLFAYYMSRALHGDADNDAGTYLRTCFQALNAFGFPRETDWVYIADAVNVRPTASACRAAFDQRSPTVYRRIFSTGAARVDDVKRALSLGHLVAFGTDVSVEFASGGFRQRAPLDPPFGVPIAGGHAMCVTGYDGDVFDVVNSWGVGWNVGGFCSMTADYIAWSETRDLWLVEHSPVYSE